MTALPIPRLLTTTDRDSKRDVVLPFVVAQGDFISIGSVHDPMRGSYMQYADLLSDHGHLLGESYEAVATVNFGNDGNGLTNNKCVLSKDKKFCFMGIWAAGDFICAYKVNIATNEVVWTYEYEHSSTNFEVDIEAIAIDSAGNIIIGGVGSGGHSNSMQIKKLNGSTGVEIWTQTLPYVSDLAIDADDNIYATIGLADGANVLDLYFLDGTDGTPIWADGVSVSLEDQNNESQPPDPGDRHNHPAYSVAIDSTGRVFVIVAQAAEGDGTPYPGISSLFEIDPADGTILLADNTGFTSTFLGRVIVRPDDTLLTLTFDTKGGPNQSIREWNTDGSFTELTADNWPVTHTTTDLYDIHNGPLKAVFLVRSTAQHLYSSEGVLITSGTAQQRFAGIAFLPVKVGIHSHPNTSPETLPAEPSDSLDMTQRSYGRDMPAFVNDTDILLFDINALYAVDDMFFINDAQPETYKDTLSVGIYKVTVEIPAVPSHVLHTVLGSIEKISDVVPAFHASWDQFEGFGGYAESGDLVVGGVHTGIGASPEYYTGSFIGLLIRSDGNPSPYNINFILRKGPGMFGMFWYFDPATLLNVLFNIGHMAMTTTIPDNSISTRIRAWLEPVLPVQYIVWRIGGPNLNRIRIESDVESVFPAGTPTKVRNSSDPLNNGDFTVDSVSFAAGVTTILFPNNTFNSTPAQNDGTTIELVPEVEMVFQYSIDVNLNSQVIQPTNVSNELIDEAGNIAYDGTCSLYPGIIDEWDAVTVWAVDDIVAWEGYFYICTSESTNQEPPHANWTQL